MIKNRIQVIIKAKKHLQIIKKLTKKKETQFEEQTRQINRENTLVSIFFKYKVQSLMSLC
jgi:hypothetical protein